jgi:hypothetical protein
VVEVSTSHVGRMREVFLGPFQDSKIVVAAVGRRVVAGTDGQWPYSIRDCGDQAHEQLQFRSVQLSEVLDSRSKGDGRRALLIVSECATVKRVELSWSALRGLLMALPGAVEAVEAVIQWL